MFQLQGADATTVVVFGPLSVAFTLPAAASAAAVLARSAARRRW